MKNAKYKVVSASAAPVFETELNKASEQGYIFQSFETIVTPHATSTGVLYTAVMVNPGEICAADVVEAVAGSLEDVSVKDEEADE